MNLFVYGTLQNHEVIEALVGKNFPLGEANLKNFKVFGLRNRDCPAMIPSPGNVAKGFLIKNVDAKSFQVIEGWEGDEYTTTEVNVDGVMATCFVWIKPQESFTENWSNSSFRLNYMARVVNEKIPAYLKLRSM